MSKVFEFFKTVWAWFYERTVIWCIFAFFILMGWGQLQKNEISLEVKEEVLDCKASCLPASSEYFFTEAGNQCWCYKDVNTLIKPQ
tara:strand:- start:157 stop:414 length:258 start_codon:yes stop_codon:yes gene_type:complete